MLLYEHVEHLTVTHDGPTLDNGDNTGSGTLAMPADILDGSCNNEGRGTWSDGGYNASTDTSCSFARSRGPPTTTAAGLSGLLGPLEANGGPTDRAIVPLPGTRL